MPDITTLSETEQEIFLCVVYVSYTEIELRGLARLATLFCEA